MSASFECRGAACNTFSPGIEAHCALSAMGVTLEVDKCPVENVQRFVAELDPTATPHDTNLAATRTLSEAVLGATFYFADQLPQQGGQA